MCVNFEQKIQAWGTRQSVLFPLLNEGFILTHHFIFTIFCVTFYNKSHTCNFAIDKSILSNTFDNQLI